MKILPAHGGCWLLAWAASGRAQAVARWLEQEHGFEVARPPVARRRLQVFRCPDPPEALHALAGRFQRFDLEGSPDGVAVLRVAARRADLDGDAAYLEAHCPGLALADVVPVGPEGHDALLTQRQHEALAQALASGYYDIPREIRLTDLADAMGMSQSSLSELLRRAERRLVEAYIDGVPEPGAALDTHEIPWFSTSGGDRSR